MANEVLPLTPPQIMLMVEATAVMALEDIPSDMTVVDLLMQMQKGLENIRAMVHCHNPLHPCFLKETHKKSWKRTHIAFELLAQDGAFDAVGKEM